MGFYSEKQEKVSIAGLSRFYREVPKDPTEFVAWFFVKEEDRETFLTGYSSGRDAYLKKLREKGDFDPLTFVQNYIEFRQAYQKNRFFNEKAQANMDFIMSTYLLDRGVTFSPEVRAANTQVFAVIDPILEEQKKRDVELALLSPENRAAVRLQLHTQPTDPQMEQEKLCIAREYKQNMILTSLAKKVDEAEKKAQSLRENKKGLFHGIRSYFAERSLRKATAALRIKQEEFILATRFDSKRYRGKEARVKQIQSGDFSYLPSDKMKQTPSAEKSALAKHFEMSAAELQHIEEEYEMLQELPYEVRERIYEKASVGVESVFDMKKTGPARYGATLKLKDFQEHERQITEQINRSFGEDTPFHKYMRETVQKQHTAETASAHFKQYQLTGKLPANFLSGGAAQYEANLVYTEVTKRLTESIQRALDGKSKDDLHRLFLSEAQVADLKSDLGQFYANMLKKGNAAEMDFSIEALLGAPDEESIDRVVRNSKVFTFINYRFSEHTALRAKRHANDEGVVMQDHTMYQKKTALFEKYKDTYLQAISQADVSDLAEVYDRGVFDDRMLAYFAKTFPEDSSALLSQLEQMTEAHLAAKQAGTAEPTALELYVAKNVREHVGFTRTQTQQKVHGSRTFLSRMIVSNPKFEVDIAKEAAAIRDYYTTEKTFDREDAKKPAYGLRTTDMVDACKTPEAARTYIEAVVRYAKNHPENIDKETGEPISVEEAYKDPDFLAIVAAEKISAPSVRKQLDLSDRLHKATAPMRTKPEAQKQKAIAAPTRQEQPVQGDSEIGQ